MARSPTVRARILLSILLVAAMGMTLAGVVTFLVQRERILSEIDDRLVASVETARSMLSDDADPTTPAFATTRGAMQAILARFVPRNDESTLGIINGEAAYAPAIETDYQLEQDAELLARIVAEASDGQVHTGVATSGDERHYIAAPVSVTGDSDIGIYVLAINVDEQLDELYRSYGTYAGVAVGALAAMALVGWFVAGRLLRPIRQLSAAASRITANDRTERIPITGRDDVSELTNTVNDMLDRLDSALTSQRQLLDDVRHELKTPITIVRGHLELLDPNSAADIVATQELVIDELDRMAGLVDDIETFAEAQGAPPNLAPCDVAAMTRAVFAKVRVLPAHAWRLDSTAAVTITADVARVTQAWLQLADNAAKYSPVDSEIVLGSGVLGSTVELWVHDAGAGIPAGSEERIFERFGRIDEGRGIRGSGLGLAIVRSIARSHGGDVVLHPQNVGSRFTIVLPVEGPQ